MKHTENWIWLPKEIYKNEQTTIYTTLIKKDYSSFTVAEFTKNYSYSKKIVRADLRFSGDTVFQLYCNESAIATGPACVGGDFIGNERPRDNFYSFEKVIFPDSRELRFFARVQMTPFHICEYSMGQGGFMLSAILTFEDGSRELAFTDESWLVRKNGAYNAPLSFDGRIAPDEFVQAESTPNIWNTATAPIPVRHEERILDEKGILTLPSGEKRTVRIDLDMIWGGFIEVSSESSGEVSVSVTTRETEDRPKLESLVLFGDQTYRGFALHSAGNIEVTAKNASNGEATVTVSFIKTHYPVSEEAVTKTSDAELNAVLNTCKHTLKICRQTHHLDSTRHCEPMACTGDYYIESLMTPFSFGDMRLAEFDLIRTAIMLERENGRMFHTTYSLIWVMMLHDVYMISGNRELLTRCERAISLLLSRFETYIGENGLIETPPDYMFIDWIYIDDITMHHPPKALGQSCLNMFYFGALGCAAAIYRELGNEPEALRLTDGREALRTAINALLFDRERQCYFEGLNTPTAEELIGKWMPQNVEKRYYLKHSNILASYFGVCDDEVSKSLIDRIMSDEIEGDCQPYFMHYLLEAIYRLGLREKYTRSVCDRWKDAVRACPKGLAEGFVAPEPTYHFDHSHAWGGTPLYSLPRAIMGLEIKKPGMSEIELSPSSLGLDYAYSELLTPLGRVVCEIKDGRVVRMTHPEGMTVSVVGASE